MIHPFFLDRGNHALFCLHYRPDGREPRGGVIYVHPFAEEMNKSRRMVSLQARAMMNAGYEVLQIDLRGCGDSSGDFSDATWQDWVSDVIAAHACLRVRCDAPLTFWGLRAGCLIIAEATMQLAEPIDFVFWQPVLSGKQHWQQFVRLKVAGEMVSGQGRGAAESIRRQLAQGASVEIAGYTVSPGLASGLENSSLSLAGMQSSHIAWLEISSRESAPLSPASQCCIGAMRSVGHQVTDQSILGPGFWQTSEIEDAPALIQATIDHLGYRR